MQGVFFCVLSDSFNECMHFRFSRYRSIFHDISRTGHVKTWDKNTLLCCFVTHIVRLITMFDELITINLFCILKYHTFAEKKLKRSSHVH